MKNILETGWVEQNEQGEEKRVRSEGRESQIAQTDSLTQSRRGALEGLSRGRTCHDWTYILAASLWLLGGKASRRQGQIQ